ncbi:TPA: hypothetical protein ACH3X1_016326 [Trebouxia sp. C0004]
MQLSCFSPMAEGASIVKTACTAVLGRFQTAPYTIPNLTGRVFAKKRKHGETTESDVYAPNHMSGMTLADLIPESMEVGFKEEDHMQPPIACLSRRLQVMLLREVNQTLNQDASIQPAEGLTHCYWPVVGCVCGITLLEDGRDQ